MRWPLAALIAMILAACGSSPATHFYELDVVAGAVPADPRGGAPIMVKAVHLPAVLDRLELVRRNSGTSLEVGDNDRWGAPLSDMTRRVLTEDLATRLPPGMILAHDAPKPAGTVRELVVDMQEFDIDGAGHARLEAGWTLLSGTTPALAVRRRETINVPGAADFATQPEAMSKALGQLADRIAAQAADGA